MSAWKTVSYGRSIFLSMIAVGIIVGVLSVGRWNAATWESGIEPGLSDDSSYVRDHQGYIYQKGYFKRLPEDYLRHFHDVSLLGRHSDTVMPKCRDPKGNDPALIKKEIRMAGPFEYSKYYKNPCWYRGPAGNQTLACIPYFYFIGTPKAGTTDLFWRIGQHPHVAPIEVKEQRWFDKFRLVDKKKKSFNFYIHQFDEAAKVIQNATRDTGYHHHIVGDGSPSYLFNNFYSHVYPGNEWCLEPRVLTISYIHHLLPTAKLILLVRNPVDRLYSDYLFNAERRKDNRTAEQFHAWAKRSVKAFTKCCEEHPFRHCLYSLDLNRLIKVHTFTAGMYSRFVLDVLKLFPRDQLLVVQTEDYGANQEKVMEEVFAFLELDPVSDSTMKSVLSMKKYNEGKGYRKAGRMFPSTRKMLYNFYKPFNKELAQILNDKKYLWPEQ